jgi:GPH family glycoside/pentoside/hexuronide:cation symporter
LLTKSGKLIYAMGRLGSSVLLSLIDLATFWLYLDFFHLGGLLIGTAFTIGKLVIAFSGWYFGYLSDVTKSERWGRRKPYILVGSISLAFSTVMIFIPQYFILVTDQTLLFIYATSFLSLANFSYGLLSTPYMAWLAEIAAPEERVAISAYQNVFAMLAQVAGVLMSFLLPVLLNGGPALASSLLLALGAFEVLLYVPALLKIREADRPIPRPSVRRELATVLGNKNYRSWLLLQGLMSMPTAILASLILSYLQGVLSVAGIQYLLVGGLLLLLTVAFYFIWTAMSRRLGKKKPLSLSLLVLMASLSLTLVIGQPILDFIPNILQASLFMTLVAAGISGWYLFLSPITADMAQEDEQARGEARAGSYNGLVSIPLNVLQSLGRFVAGLLADLPKVEGHTYTWGLVLWGPVSSILLLPCLFLLVKYVKTDPLVRTHQG